MERPGAAQDLATAFDVTINGAALGNDLVPDVLELQVCQSVDSLSMFALRAVNWSVSTLEITWSDNDLFKEGNEVEISMGYVDRLQLLFHGEITGIEPAFCAGQVPEVTIRGYDRGHRLTRGRKTRTFTQVSDSDIAETIAGERTLSAEVVSTGVAHDFVMQANQTDRDFLLARARPIGYECFVKDKTLHFRPRAHAEEEVVTLDREADLLEFCPRLSTMGQAGEVQLIGWSPADKDKILAQSPAANVTAPMGEGASGPDAAAEVFDEALSTTVRRPVSGAAQADLLTQGMLDEMALGYIRGHGLCVGRPELEAGKVVKIEGAGQRFSGSYYLHTVTHSFTTRHGFRTAFTVMRNAT